MQRSGSFARCTISWPILSALVAALQIATGRGAEAQTSQSPWGLRNINEEAFGLDAWPACPEFQTSFAGHQAGYVNFWILWSDVEPPSTACPVGASGCDPTSSYDYALLQSGLDKSLSIGATPVIHFKLTNSALMQFAGANMYTRPLDMCTPQAVPQYPTATPCPGVHGLPFAGYSERLYLVSKAMAEQIRARYDLTLPLPTCAPPISDRNVYVEFHPEEWDEWPLGSYPDENLNTYILSYLTVRQAFKDVEGTTSAVTFHLSHGSIPRFRVLGDLWYEQGKAGGAEVKSAMVTRFRSLTERIPNRIRAIEIGGTSIGPTIDSWTEVLCFASAAEDNPSPDARAENLKNDAWMSAIVDWTCQGFFDFDVYHGHGKPRWDDQERAYFDQRLLDEIALGRCAITAPPPWIIGEAAFEVLDSNGDWPAFAGSEQKAIFLANRDRFVLQDYARKWCTMTAQDLVAAGAGSAVTPGSVLLAFCSPVIAGNNTGSGAFPNYTGLFKSCGGAGQPACSGASLPQTTLPLQRIDPFPANQAFIGLSSAIGAPDSITTLIDDGSKVLLRFDSTLTAGGIIDALWKREWLDITTASTSVAIPRPSGYTKAQVKVLDSQGNLVNSGGQLTPGPTLTVTGVTQEPRFVFWSP
jgi:hypothetical protein